VFTARYALSPYIKQIRFVFKGLIPFIYLRACECPDSECMAGGRGGLHSVGCSKFKLIYSANNDADDKQASGSDPVSMVINNCRTQFAKVGSRVPGVLKLA
jgi:hypothetical protein